MMNTKDYINIFKQFNNNYKLFDVQSVGSNLAISFRDGNGNRYNEFIKDFLPYFFVPKQKVSYHKPLLEIDNCNIVYCNHPAEVKDKRDSFEFTYEADILYDYRFNFDILNMFNENVDIEPRIWYIDIEVFNNYNNTFPVPNSNDNYINSISIYDNYDDRYVTIVVIPNKSIDTGILKNDNEYIIKVNNEEKLIEIFIKLLLAALPDIISGWNVLLFDIPFIIEKIIFKYKNYLKKLSPFNLEPRQSRNRVYDSNEYEIPGFVVLDYQLLYEKYGERLPKYSLEYVSQHVLKRGKVKYDNSLDYIYENDFNLFLKYNKEDIVLVKELENELGFISLVDTIKSITYCKLYSFNFSNTLKLGDTLFMKYLRNKFEKVYVMKTRDKIIKKSNYSGAIVKEPEVGLYYDYIIDFDATSMYPSIIRTLNISPETFIVKVNEDKDFISKKLRKYLLDIDDDSLDDNECEVLFEDDNVRTIQLGKLKKFLYNRCNGNNFSISLNGSIFDLSKIGVLKLIEDDLFELRNKTKNIKKIFGKLQNI